MSDSIYIRPLAITDALISYQWRNNPKLWRYTGSKPDRHITPEIETEWLKAVLQRTDEKRYAICLRENDRYIGNVFLTDITATEAQMHIFIGEIQFWGNHRAEEAIVKVVAIGLTELGLKVIYGQIDENNKAALAVAYRAGFVEQGIHLHETLKRRLVRTEFTREMFERTKPASGLSGS